MNDMYDKIMSQHLALNEAVAQDPDAVDLDTIQAFLREVRTAGAEVTNMPQRDQLRNVLRQWGAVVYERTGEYPPVQLAPAHRQAQGETSKPVPEIQGPGWPSRNVLLLGGAFVAVVLIVVVLLLLVRQPAGDPPVDVEEVLSQAQTTLEEGRYGEAVDTFAQVLNAEPNNLQAIQGIGQAYAAQGEWAQASEWFEKWVEAAPSSTQARLALGQAYYNLEEYEKAKEQFMRVTELRSDVAEGYQWLSRVYFELEQYEQGIGALREWLRFEPSNVEAYSLLAPSHFRLGEYEQALAEYQRWIEAAGEDANAYVGLGRTLNALGRYQQAIEAFQQADSLQPGQVGPQQGLAEAYFQLGEYATALTYYQRWSQLDPSSAAAVQGVERTRSLLETIYDTPRLSAVEITECNITFQWNWSGELAEDEWFSLRVGAKAPTSIVWTRETQHTISLREAGDYVWQVAVCRGDPAQGDCEELAASEISVFSFRGCPLDSAPDSVQRATPTRAPLPLETPRP
jgi:tetratricopeptide (TPR) repeat protein